MSLPRRNPDDEMVEVVDNNPEAPTNETLATESTQPSCYDPDALKAGIITGTIGTDVSYYIGSFVYGLFEKRNYFYEPGLHLTGIATTILGGCVIGCEIKADRSLGWGIAAGIATGLLNSAINYGISMAGVPAWAAPLITTPIVVGMTLAAPHAPKAINYVSKNCSSFWNRASSCLPSMENISLLLRNRPGYGMV